MEYVFALPESCSVAWSGGNVWLNRNDAWFADDPFVAAHPEMFSATPSRVASSTGRTAVQVPLTDDIVPDSGVAVIPAVLAAVASRPRGRSRG